MPVKVVAQLINFNTADLTSQCVESLIVAGIDTVHVLDNASREEDRSRLRSLSETWPAGISVTFSNTNLGFAAGSNLLIDQALADGEVTHVFLINSDAVVSSAGFALLLETVGARAADMYGARMMKRGNGCDGQVDSLGIALYRPLLASNRKHAYERYLGPTGGLAVYSRHLLETLRAAHGYCFDPDYFCYAEDTDLCIRARLLGFEAQFIDAVVAYHMGQASSGGGFNDFVYYHGIRNSVLTLLKSVPARLLLRNLHWILLLHAGILLRHTLRGKFLLTLKIYRDAFARLPSIWRQRRRIMAAANGIDGLAAAITPRFYEEDYLAAAIRDLFHRRGGIPRR